MNHAWYQVLSLIYGYLSAAAIVVVLLAAIKRIFSDAALLRRVRKHTPQVGAVGTLRVLSAGSRRLPAGTKIRVPYEGTLGSSHSCDVHIPYRRIHMRSAFFWMEKDGLHMVALHKDGLFADDVAVNPGDEAILEDGAVLRIRELKFQFSLHQAAISGMDALDVGPYVTSERRSSARQGRAEGIGAPGRGEKRREKKLAKKLVQDNGKKPARSPAGKKKDDAAPRKQAAKKR